MFGDKVVLEYVIRGFLLLDLFLNQVLATTSVDGRVESDLPGWTSESNRPFNKPNTNLAAKKKTTTVVRRVSSQMKGQTFGLRFETNQCAEGEDCNQGRSFHGGNSSKERFCVAGVNYF